MTGGPVGAARAATAYLTTLSGVQFDLLHPDPAAVRIGDIAAALAKLARCCGHTELPVSVAQHSVTVHDLLPFDARPYGLLHDAHEAYMGDIITPAHLALAALGAGAAIDRFKALLDRAIFRAFGLSYPMPAAIAAAVLAADRTALATEARDFMHDAALARSAGRPAPRRQNALPWPQAEALFLDRFDRLCLPRPPAGRR